MAYHGEILTENEAEGLKKTEEEEDGLSNRFLYTLDHFFARFVGGVVIGLIVLLFTKNTVQM